MAWKHRKIGENMTERRFGTWSALNGVILTYFIEYALETALAVNAPPSSLKQSLFPFNVLFAIIICFATVAVNYKVNKWFELRTSWNNNPIKRFTLQAILTTVFCSVLSAVTVFGTYSFFTERPMSLVYVRLMLVLGWTISMLLSSTYSGFVYFTQWKKMLRESEELKRDILQTQFNALKSQINPHFLFNNLTTLGGLIEADPPVAVDFVQKLASVYRYVLQSMNLQLVELDTELNFLNAYIFLLKMRFPKGLYFETNVPIDVHSFLIAPLTLQILIENAVKHNVVSSDKPLKISIICRPNGLLVVKNNIQKKQSTEASTHVGLQNIHSRYRFLSQKHIVIEETKFEFIVQVPLIEKDRT
jgi:LytS/YehU family sensor histidine kinase